jgi:phenylpropionate dioxygenase-like ring-hydroxylating dioxygenase large terminal subunit
MNEQQLKQQWFPLCDVKSLKNNTLKRVVLFNTPIVVFKTKTQIAALLDVCPHRGAMLSKGKLLDDILTCPYHGWQFNSKGECVNVPGLCKAIKSSTKNVSTIDVKVHLGLVFVCLEKTTQTKALYVPLHHDNATYDSFIWPIIIEGECINIIENFLDACHTHFVHDRLIRREKKRNQINAYLKVDSNTAEVTYRDGQKQSGLISKLFERNRSHSTGRFSYPLIAELEYHSKQGLTLAMTAFISPESAKKHRIFMLLTYKKNIIPGWLKRLFFMPFLKKALNQDISILKQQMENINTFTPCQFTSTELDVLRPHIERIIARQSREYTKIVTMNL